MEILPRTLGTRPRLACEVRAEGVVAARAEDASAVLSSVSKVPLGSGFTLPQMRLGETGGDGTATIAASHPELVNAVRKALEGVSQRGRDVTLVVPDAAVRVLLVDFDTLPNKVEEALPVVRFRLKKLLPFDAEHAAVSYQVMSSTRDSVQVLAVAMPRELLTEYEGVVRDAGFEPGAVLPSTLASLSGLDGGEIPVLVVNAARDSVTTAIVRSGVLLLHRTVELGANEAAPIVEEKVAAPADTSFSAIAARMAGAGRLTPVSAPAAEPKSDGPGISRSEVAQAISVAVAYFEDTLQAPPSLVMAAGTLGADVLTSILDEANVGPVAVQEMVDRQMLGPGATSGVPLGWLAGVRGALAH